ncbi:hypothetical protein [Ensifer aridi]|uniref:hypothetical protein n=1 Tax=Ensifer aridi TaxID=1708715 RepID=UPI00111C88C0|nr:hypothetical protein [Ensifer aridi]
MPNLVETAAFSFFTGKRQLKNILCQIHSDHRILHPPSSLFCGLHHITLAHCDVADEEPLIALLAAPTI